MEDNRALNVLSGSESGLRDWDGATKHYPKTLPESELKPVKASLNMDITHRDFYIENAQNIFMSSKKNFYTLSKKYFKNIWL